MDHKTVLETLQKEANSEKVKKQKRFFKTEKGAYGEGDQFLGISVPVLRSHIKTFEGLPLEQIELLLKNAYHEVRLFAVFLLVKKYKKSKSSEIQKQIFDFYIRNKEWINNWDIVDSSAPYISGPYLYEKDKSLLFELSKSESLWDRRIAMLSTLFFIKQGEFQTALKLAKILLQDPEDLIQKAVGWMLREVGKKDKATEVNFLKKYYRLMPRTMLRYAIEKFPEEERQSYLLG